jgi:hypothetical protein
LRRLPFAFALAVAVLPVGGAQAVPLPQDDAFYKSPPKKVLRSERPGTVLNSREVKLTGVGIPLPFKAWQLQYRSTDSIGRPVAVVGTLALPAGPTAGPRPLLSYQMAIDSLAPQCNPAYTMRTGTQRELPFVGIGLLQGWAVMVPDFEGPRDAYGAGPMAGHATLDGIRAAERFKAGGLAGRKTPVGMWGYSGGGQATAWAAELQPRYAPELSVAGVAEGGVPSNLRQVAENINGGPFAGVYFAVAVGLSREYPELRIQRLLNDDGRQMVDHIGKECADTLITGYPLQRIGQYTNVDNVLDDPRVRRVVAKGGLGKRIPTAPLYVYHSSLDELIPVAGPDAMVKRYCQKGAQVVYERSLLGEHVAFVATGGPAALSYLIDRFAGKPAPSTC